MMKRTKRTTQGCIIPGVGVTHIHMLPICRSVYLSISISNSMSTYKHEPQVNLHTSVSRARGGEGRRGPAGPASVSSAPGPPTGPENNTNISIAAKQQQQQPVLCGTLYYGVVHASNRTHSVFTQLSAIYKLHMLLRHLTHLRRQRHHQQCTRKHGSGEFDDGDLLWRHRLVSVVAQSPGYA